MRMVKSTLRQLSLKAVIKNRSHCITPRPGLAERARQALAAWGVNLKSVFWGWEPESGHSPSQIIHLSHDGLKNLRN